MNKYQQTQLMKHYGRMRYRDIKYLQLPVLYTKQNIT